MPTLGNLALIIKIIECRVEDVFYAFRYWSSSLISVKFIVNPSTPSVTLDDTKFSNF